MEKDKYQQFKEATLNKVNLMPENKLLVLIYPPARMDKNKDRRETMERHARKVNSVFLENGITSYIATVRDKMPKNVAAQGPMVFLEKVRE